MKERHDCQQAITLCEVQPFTNLSRIRDEVAVREQATLGFSRGAGCVNYDRIVVGIEAKRVRSPRVSKGFLRRLPSLTVGLLTRKLTGSSFFIIKRDYRLQVRKFSSDSFNSFLKLRVNKDGLRFRVIHHEFDLMFFEERIDRPSQGAQLPTGEITNDVFRAVRQQQADNIAFGYALGRQQRRRAINCCKKLRIRELPAIRLGKQKHLVWGTGDALCKQIAGVKGFASHGSKHCNLECGDKRSGIRFGRPTNFSLSIPSHFESQVRDKLKFVGHKSAVVATPPQRGCPWGRRLLPGHSKSVVECARS